MKEILNDLKAFCNAYTRIYIYGAGNVGKMVSEYLESQGIEFEGFCVSCLPGDTTFCSHQVVTFDDERDSLCDTGYIVALSHKIAGDVVKKLTEAGADYIYSKECLFEIFCEHCRNSAEMVSVNNDYLEQVKEYAFDKDTVYICCPASIGDTLYVSALVKEYKKQCSCKSVCLIVKKGHASFITLFKAIDDYIVSDDLVQILNEYSMYQQTWVLNNYIYGHFPKDMHFKYDDSYYKEEWKNIVARYTKLIMRLHGDIKIEDIYIDSKYMAERSNYQNTIILMPYAQTAPMLPISFWDKIVHILCERGYNLYTNVNGNKEVPLHGTKALSLSLYDTAVVCENAVGVISLRSGICDLLAFTKSNLIIINTSEELYEEWNIKDVFKKDNIFNINCFDERQMDNCCVKLQKCLDYFKSDKI